MSETILNPEIGMLFKRYRKKQLNPLTAKPWTLQELSDELALYIEQHTELAQEGSLSPSAISRLENGTLLPSRAKLKMLADFLEIPEQELKPLIDLSQERTRINDPKERGRVREIESKLYKTPLDWLRLISYANIAGDYIRSLSLAEDALLALATPLLALPEKNVVQALINSKKSYAQSWLERDKLDHLRRSQQWAYHAQQELQALKLSESPELTLLCIETLRCLTTATQEIFDYRYLREPQYYPDEQVTLEKDYAELQALFSGLEQSIRLDNLDLASEQGQQLLELFLYFRRERDRLSFKWLEARELYALRRFIQQRLTWLADLPAEPSALAVMLYEYLVQRPAEALKVFRQLYTTESSGLVFTPAPELQMHWQELSESMLTTLELHDRLQSPNPNRGYQEAVLLYPLTVARLGHFDRLADLAYFKLIYMHTTPVSRPFWYYARAYCYALLYRQSQNPVHLQEALKSWFHYAEGNLTEPRNLKAQFSGLLQEAALWSTFLPLLQDQKESQAYQDWFACQFETLINQKSYRHWRQRATQALSRKA